MVVNDLLRETSGGLEAAAQFIGDRDLKAARGSYRRERDHQLAALADQLDRRVTGTPADAPEPAPKRRGQTVAAPQPEEAWSGAT
jgi:hypothetical protein